MYQSDLESNLRVAERTGRKTGLAEGRKEGQRKERIEIVRNMLSDGLSIEKVAQYTKLPREKIEELL
jgi:predicted transposase/invertase (TIGR01784 family)